MTSRSTVVDVTTTEPKIKLEDPNKPAKRHIFGIWSNAYKQWVLGVPTEAGTLMTALCGELAMATGERYQGAKPVECEKCRAIRDRVIFGRSDK